jgi:purine-binding chemotaxis protein CheW
MELGLSLESKKVVTFQLGDDIFGIDIMAVREIIKLENVRELPDAPDYFYGILNLRGEIVPLINFKKIFGFKGFDFEKDKDVIICMVSDKIFGLVIDRVIKVTDYERGMIGPPPSLTTQVQSALISGVLRTDEYIISIIDIYALFSQKGQNFLSFDKFNKATFQSSLMESYFSIGDKEVIKKIFAEIEYPFNEYTKKGVLEYVVKQAIKYKVKINDVLSFIRNKHISYIPSYFFYKNTAGLIFYNDEDFLTLQKLVLKVILPAKRSLGSSDFKTWIISSSGGEDGYSMLFILAVLFEEEFDIEYTVISSGDNLDLLNKGASAKFSAKSVSRLTHGVKRYLFEDVPEEKDKADKQEFVLKKEFKNRIFFDLYFNSSNAPKRNIDLIYAPNYFSKLPKEKLEKQLEVFYNSLNTGGVLVCGKFESFGLNPGKFKTFMLGTRIYYRKEPR